MFKKVDILSVVAGLSLLGGCVSGNQVSRANDTTILPTQRTNPLSTIQPDKGCAGTRHVTVDPCPVVLTEYTRAGIVVTVKGQHVADSKLGRFASCFNNEHCYDAERIDSSQTQWRITSGPSCGDALVKFRALSSRGRRIGFFYEEISNKYCP